MTGRGIAAIGLAVVVAGAAGGYQLLPSTPPEEPEASCSSCDARHDLEKRRSAVEKLKARTAKE